MQTTDDGQAGGVFTLTITQLIDSRYQPGVESRSFTSERAAEDEAREWLKEEDSRRERNRRAGTNQGPALTGLEIATPAGATIPMHEIRRRSRIIED